MGPAVDDQARLVSDVAKVAQAVLDFLEPVGSASDDAIGRQGQQPLDDGSEHDCRCQSCCARKVSQFLMSPLCRPRLNQRTRCSDVPWVKLSGTTRPWAWRCSRSSPMAVAAASA